MKKLLSVLLSASIFASLLAVPALADYEKAEYDVERFSETYDSGEVTNEIDDSPAMHFEDTADIFGGTIYKSGFLESDFFLTLDFNYYTDAEDNVPGEISFTGDNQGPKLTYDKDGGKKNKGDLVSEHDSKNWDSLGPISPDTWYTMEVEGRLKVSVDFRIYEYKDGVKTLVTETKGLYLRNYAPGNSGKNSGKLNATNVYIDNVKLYSTHPDKIDVTTSTDEYELRAGKSVPLEYAPARSDGKAVTNDYPVTLELLDESGNPINDENVYLTSNTLVTTVDAADQTVTVKASATVGEKTLVDTRTQIKINAVSTDSEPFDTVVVEGPESVKAGETAEYTFKATKNGNDVTDSLQESDYKWLLYSNDDLYENNNNAISITGGKTATLTVDEGVIAQKLKVRLSTNAGLVFGSKTVDIGFADSYKDEVLAYNAAEEAISTATRVPSIDGSLAYQTTANTIISLGSKREDYVLTEFDICFATDGSGVYWERGLNGGEKWNTSLYLQGTEIKSQVDSSKWASLGVNATTEDWFHFEVLYTGINDKDKGNPGIVDASCIVTKYNEDGTLGTPQTFLNITTRNGDAYGSLEISKGVIIDNIKISIPTANELVLAEPAVKEILAGQSMEFSATASRNGLPLKGVQLNWQVIGEDGLVITGDDALVKISDTGVLTTDAMAKAQTVTVKVSSGVYSKQIDIQVLTSEIFKIKNIGKNEEETKITRLYVDKKFNYNNEVTFIIAIYDANGKLTGVATRQMYGDQLQLGENELTFDLDLPVGFNPDTDEISVMTWTMF